MARGLSRNNRSTDKPSFSSTRVSDNKKSVRVCAPMLRVERQLAESIRSAASEERVSIGKHLFRQWLIEAFDTERPVSDSSPRPDASHARRKDGDRTTSNFRTRQLFQLATRLVKSRLLITRLVKFSSIFETFFWRVELPSDWFVPRAYRVRSRGKGQ